MENKLEAVKIEISSKACPFQGTIEVIGNGYGFNTIYFRQRSGRLIAYMLPGKKDEMTVIKYGWRFYNQPEKEETLSIEELLERLNIQ